MHSGWKRVGKYCEKRANNLYPVYISMYKKEQDMFQNLEKNNNP
jgi:hypothetical protein